MAALTLREILSFDVLGAAAPEILCGEQELDRPVRWVHSSEIYEIGPLLSGGELLLTTGLGLAGADAGARRHYVRELAERGVAGVAVELGRSLTEMPYELLDESRRRGLPLVALRAVVPFIRIAEAANTAIVTQSLTDRPYPAADRDGRAAALLADLAEGTARSQPEVLARARALDFRPDRTHRLLGVAATGTGADAALDRAALALDAELLRAPVTGGLAALLAVPAGAQDAVRAAQAALTAGPPAGYTLALGPACPADAAWSRWGESLREARTALGLALTVPPAEPAPRSGALVTSSRALALERQLTGDGLTPASRDRLAHLVSRALGPLLEWEAAHPSDLVRTLEVHLRNGCSPTRTAALLHVGRQSLYQRLDRIESLLGLPVTAPDSHTELLLATCAHRLLRAQP
ncbi:PucR family transcriptional regulator [Streptacidiphilus sp. PB12-B1b]|uniref:PucR family transcriptional regulator n=1 Tax=Streptacidiphilus sp. PB12-B1b TaxID=2705012 RepID=UPI0015FE558A|nr:PucR family transcriptional regulator [Streptacidiphilus sp. PB12-B1b]QMU74953.1 PucR family transcriptional regulator [Streptacidiphilus sp. PB12-B1b]